jgi:hypothetical protein
MLMSFGCFLDAISDVIFQLSLINNAPYIWYPGGSSASQCAENNAKQCEVIDDVHDAFRSGGTVRFVALVLLIVVALKEFSKLASFPSPLFHKHRL